ncbi:MAG: CocE/NonD family hydrolase [Alphaproteobacteria bacterium]|nr:CocE/NonD family hydrolase [Alphaproteobacteria bacterium]
MSPAPLDTAPAAQVREVANVFVPMKSGLRIAVRLFLPADAETNPVPAILDFFPYRKSDFSCWRDSANYGYMATQGYACVKADSRGTGDSDGLQRDQFSPQYIDDAVELIEWIARQKWCTGKVGMTGVSWPAHASLMTAARRPPALGAIMPLNAADDRYLNKYQGGCFLLYGVTHSAFMVSLNTRPPRPSVVGDAWRDAWRERIDCASQPVESWLQHPWQDEYWAGGSVANNFKAIGCPVYAVAGFADVGYVINIPRLLNGLDVPRKGLMGPWGHRYFLYPGPNIHMLGEMKRWFDHWLKGIDTGIMSEPQVHAYIHESAPPDPGATTLPGHWVAERQWPPAGITPRRYAINAGGLAAEAGGEVAVTVRTPLTVGMMAGEWMPWYVAGPAPELAADQRIDDGQSVCFDSAPLERDFDMLGAPTVTVELASDQPQAQLVVRLCEVFPDGTSRRVTYGFVDLAHRDGDKAPAPVEPGKRIQVRLPLYPTGYAFKAGNRLRLAVSTSYWPIIWPTPRIPTLTLFAGASFLELPERARRDEDSKVRDLGKMTIGPGVPQTVLRKPSVRHTYARDAATGETSLTVEADIGRTRLDDRDIENETVHRRCYSIRPDDPLSARVESRWEVGLREGDWSIGSRVENATWATAEAFEIDTRLDLTEGGRPFHARVFRSTVKRGGGV